MACYRCTFFDVSNSVSSVIMEHQTSLDLVVIASTLGIFAAVVVSPGPNFALISRLALQGHRTAANGAVAGFVDVALEEGPAQIPPPPPRADERLARHVGRRVPEVRGQRREGLAGEGHGRARQREEAALAAVRGEVVGQRERRRVV